MDAQAEPTPSTPTHSRSESPLVNEDAFSDDDPQDPPFNDIKPFKSKFTPQQRKLYAEECSQQAKKRVDKATQTLTQSRCLITNAPESCSVQYAHLLPRATKSETVSIT